MSAGSAVSKPIVIAPEFDLAAGHFDSADMAGKDRFCRKGMIPHVAERQQGPMVPVRR